MLRLKLVRPLVVFDLETTGLDIAVDSIIQVAYVKVYPDGREQRDSMLINPGKPIPAVVTELTGISDVDVVDKPTFRQLVAQLFDIFDGCDLAGFNSNHFDVPLLVEEFLRVGKVLDLSNVNLIDTRGIFCKMEQRNLAAAYEFYCGHKMEDDFEAHRADQDAEATYRVLIGELAMYSPERQTDEKRVLSDDPKTLAEFVKNNDNIDFAGRFIMQDGCEVINFGKYKGQKVTDVLRRDPSYYQWMMNGSFTLDTKQCLQRIYLKMRYNHK